MSIFESPIKYTKGIIWKVLFFTMTKKVYEKLRAKAYIGYWPNIDKPQSFNEKAIARKLNPDKRYKFYADKVRVRDFVIEKIGNEYLNEVYFVCKNIDDIPWGTLPNKLVIKSNHGGGDVGVFIINDLKHYDKQYIIDQLEKGAASNFGHLTNETWYTEMDPLIFGEELMVDSDNESPADYRFHCFGGKCKFIQMDYGRTSGVHRTFYDREWNKLDIKMFYPQLDEIPPPKNLQKMIEIAEKLSEDFKYIRIDLYDLKHKIIFGEMTFTPVAGWARFDKKETDFAWGKLIPD